ncbi:MAG TPA: response regulator transcription factor [Eubacteriales bacterium]|nr:response regulator transcription factor [Eubacteriales bacterium]
MKKILVVDDEQGIRDLLKEYLEMDEYQVSTAVDGLDAVNKCKTGDFDLIIMDIMMPKMDGISAVKEIRKNSSVPVLMLSARDQEYDKLFGFEVGADDYVTKPFSTKEVMARVRSILSRTNPDKMRNVEQFGGLVVDFDGRNVIVDGVKAELTPKEYELLFYLVKNKGLAVSREKLLTNVWGFEFYGDDRTVDTHIKMLRGNLGAYRDCIVTLRGLGYKFEYEEIKG